MMSFRRSHDLTQVVSGAGATDHRRRGVAEDDPAISIDDRHRDRKLVQHVRHAIFIEPTTSKARTIDSSMEPLHTRPLRQALAAHKNLRPRDVYATARGCSEDVHSATLTARHRGRASW
jgi:hypothetical protein